MIFLCTCVQKVSLFLNLSNLCHILPTLEMTGVSGHLKSCRKWPQLQFISAVGEVGCPVRLSLSYFYKITVVIQWVKANSIYLRHFPDNYSDTWNEELDFCFLNTWRRFLPDVSIVTLRLVTASLLSQTCVLFLRPVQWKTLQMALIVLQHDDACMPK